MAGDRMSAPLTTSSLDGSRSPLESVQEEATVKGEQTSLFILTVPEATFGGNRMSNGVLHTVSANLSRGISLSGRGRSAKAFDTIHLILFGP